VRIWDSYGVLKGFLRDSEGSLGILKGFLRDSHGILKGFPRDS
jgi:hypothetical protein